MSRRSLDQRTYLRALEDGLDVASLEQVEHDDRKIVVATERDRSRIHHLQSLVDDLEITDVRVLRRGRILLRICGVHTIDSRVRALQYRLRGDLCCAQCGGGVGREERVTRSTREDDDATLLQVTLSATTDVGLCDLGHLDGAHHARLQIGRAHV